MNAPVLTYRFEPARHETIAELTRVRLLQVAVTDDGVEVSEGSEGTVVGVWPSGVAYEVDFPAGLATVAASILIVA